MSLENSPSFLLDFSECEMTDEEKHFYQFKSFRLDVAERRLSRNGETLPLTPKAFDVLAALVGRGGHLVEKDELLKSVWADSFVEEANVARIVHTLRKVLGEDDNGNKFIETVAKKGYRFVAHVDEIREPVERNHENGNQNFAIAAEKLPETITAENSFKTVAAKRFPETDSQISPTANDEIVSPPMFKPKHAARVFLFTVGFLSAVFLLLLMSFNWQSNSSLNPNEPKSIAVLPLKSLTTEKRDAIYELGIADSLILKLSTVKNLVVRSLSATQEYADVKKDAVAIGLEQKVDYVLASNYQIAEGKIRITSQLIKVSNGAVEEVFKDEQNISNAFAVQDAFAANIGRKLLQKLNREPNDLSAKRGTTNEEAYRLYLQGMNLTDTRNAKNARQAFELFEQAVRLDPNFAQAYVGLAYSVNTFYDTSNPHEDYVKSMDALRKALALDENLAEAHSFLGQLQHTYEWKRAEAEKSFRRAIELNPNSSFAHRFYALYLCDMGRFDEALAEMNLAIDLDPNSSWNQRLLGNIYYYARRYDEGIAQLKRTVEMDASHLPTYKWLYHCYEMKGDYAGAFEWFLRFQKQRGKSVEELNSWRTIFDESGWKSVLRRSLAEAKQTERAGKIQVMEAARLSAQLGDTEEAFAYLEKAFLNRELFINMLLIEPRLDSLRADPRFDDLVKRVRLK
jgi:DNA-binding winged helix-turn-helix (wHTH) protein/TolB-like protein/Tfp pilus assembly protein PilF